MFLSSHDRETCRRRYLCMGGGAFLLELWKAKNKSEIKNKKNGGCGGERQIAVSPIGPTLLKLLAPLFRLSTGITIHSGRLVHGDAVAAWASLYYSTGLNPYNLCTRFIFLYGVSWNNDCLYLLFLQKCQDCTDILDVSYVGGDLHSYALCSWCPTSSGH